MCIRDSRKVPRSTYSYLHLAVMAGRHLFGEHSLTNWELPRVGQWNWELPTYPFKDVANLEIIRVVLQVIPTPSHLLGRISPIFSPFFPVFCAFSPS